MADIREEWKEFIRSSSYLSRLEKNGGDEEDFWKRFSASDTMNDYSGYPGDICEWICGKIDPGCTIADIGCGSGRYAGPLSAYASHIYAIDPSHIQLERYRSAASSIGGCTFSFFEDTWANVHIGKVDYVIAAYSFLVEDIDAFVDKMMNCMRKGAFFVFRAGQPDKTLAALRNISSFRSFDYEFIMKLLEEKGYRAQFEIFSRDYSVPYPLFCSAYSWYIDDPEVFHSLLADHGRIITLNGAEHVSCHRSDAAIFVPE
ncbi:MAG TPA: class I SAM-dependent methyltransferase [Candidatus Methanofastidiosa archaeon]|nr:class I SAM-dependent methyltransferase [Candidatus Methanofastidiosa archaeon]